jgi:hypothetical protein
MRESAISFFCLFLATAAIAADAPRPTVTRKGSISGFGDTDIRFPGAGVERAARITESDGGYLDLARSKDGRQLWTRQWWDDGSTDVNHFQLNWAGDRKLVLQFVDSVTEPWPADKDTSDEIGRHVIKRADGTKVQQFLDAWPIDPEKAEAFSLASRTWIPLVPARAKPPADVRKLQWMVFVPRCPELGKACVYFGKPEDVCRKYFATIKSEDETLWIAPRKCR